MDHNENLISQIEVWLNTKKAPTDLPELVVQQVRPLRRREEKELAAKERKRLSLRNRKPYTRRRGTVHPKRKLATAKRRYKRQWEKKPYDCLVNGWGVYRIDKALWAKYIAPLWETYDAENLSIRKYPGYGTKAKPHTIYTIDVIHRTRGVLYNGNDQLIYDLSSP